MSRQRVRVGRREFDVSNPDKVLFPGDGITKGDLIDYYHGVAPHILRYLQARPIAMERYPDGLRGERIFQKRIPEHFPEWVDRVSVHKEDGRIEHVVCGDEATLVCLANQACITPHLWFSTVDSLDRPEELIFDLDPPGDGFGPVRAAAMSLRALLEGGLRLASFVKTTGGKGLHVTVPLDRRGDFDSVRPFARDVAEELVRRDPDRLTVEQRKGKRRGKLFVDTMRNAYAQTAAPPYAVRARPGATVAVPLDWNELEDGVTPTSFTLRSVPDRLEERDDPWKGMRRRARSIAEATSAIDTLAAER